MNNSPTVQTHPVNLIALCITLVTAGIVSYNQLHSIFKPSDDSNKQRIEQLEERCRVNKIEIERLKQKLG